MVLGLKMLPEACGLRQHFRDLAVTVFLYIYFSVVIFNILLQLNPILKLDAVILKGTALTSTLSFLTLKRVHSNLKSKYI